MRNDRKTLLRRNRKVRIDLLLRRSRRRIGFTSGHRIRRVNIESQCSDDFFPELKIRDLVDLDEVTDESAESAGSLEALAGRRTSAVLAGAARTDGMLRRVVQEGSTL